MKQWQSVLHKKNHKENSMLDYRYVAQITVEAATPLAVASGKNDVLTDSPICVDANGLPCINGTSLAGVLRHQFAEENSKIEHIFGYQDQNNSENSEGSRIIVSNAHIIGENGEVIEGIVDPEKLKTQYFKHLLELPFRQHCKINHKGVSDKESHGKYDQQVVPKGARFRFEIELQGTKEDIKNWDSLLGTISRASFRIGGGTRKGFGKLEIIPHLSHTKIYDLRKSEDLQSYLDKSSSLNKNFSEEKLKLKAQNDNTWKIYTLSLEPENLWFFGSGLPDSDADMTPVYESTIVWENQNPKFIEKQILIPATSVKGAISHRVAYHYNRLKKFFADQTKNLEAHVGENNMVVRELFGHAKDSKNKQGHIGNVIFSDLFLKNEMDPKLLNHVSIDRFTGGAIDSALFTEKVLKQKERFELEMLVNTKVFRDEDIKKAFEFTIEDICKGMLPLGGGVMRGHGVFTGRCPQVEEKNQ